MKHITTCLCLLLTFFVQAQDNLYFFGSRKHGPPDILSDKSRPVAKASATAYTEYTIDIAFRNDVRGSVLSKFSKGCFITQRGKLYFNPVPENIAAGNNIAVHHVIITRNNGYIGIYIDNYRAGAFADAENIFDVGFPWFDIQLLSQEEKNISFPEIGTVTISAQSRIMSEELLSKEKEEQGSAGFLKIFPNPVTDHLNINIKNKVLIKITDLSGKQVLLQQSANAGYLTIPVLYLPAGVYLLSAIGGRRTIVQKFIKH